MTEQVQMYELYAVLDDRPLVFGPNDGLVYLDTVEEYLCEKRVQQLVAEADSRLDGAYKVWAHPANQPMSILSSEGFNIDLLP